MTLSELLQIDERMLSEQDVSSLEFCEQCWRMSGHPEERYQLAGFIDKMLVELNTGGVHYPRILLRRRKELLRGTFRPRPQHRKTATPQIEGPAAADACPICKGAGHLAGDLCRDCLGRGKKRAQQNPPQPQKEALPGHG